MVRSEGKNRDTTCKCPNGDSGSVIPFAPGKIGFDPLEAFRMRLYPILFSSDGATLPQLLAVA